MRLATSGLRLRFWRLANDVSSEFGTGCRFWIRSFQIESTAILVRHCSSLWPSACRFLQHGVINLVKGDLPCSIQNNFFFKRGNFC